MSYTEDIEKTMTKPKGKLKTIKRSSVCPHIHTTPLILKYPHVYVYMYMHTQMHACFQTHIHTSKKFHKLVSEGM